MGLRGPALSLYLLFVMCWSSGHSHEEDGGHAMHDPLDVFEPSSRENARTLRESGIESRAEQEARAKELMLESEKDSEDVQQEAERYRHSREKHRQAAHMPGRSARWHRASQEDSEAERIRFAMQESDPESTAESDPHSDLGEGAAVDEATEATATDANAMTALAQLKAKQRAASAAKQRKLHSAKQIAAKVKKLVAVQRHLEEQANVPHNGMVDMKQSVDATKKITEDAKSQMKDSLIAQKMEAETARTTFKHLMEQEREEQHTALEAERKRSNAVLETVKKSLQERQKQITSQMVAVEKTVEAKLEKTVAKTQIASAVEEAVKHKLSKRVEQLTRAGQQVVGGVTDSVNSLKRRVRRLRRSQDRIRSEQSTVERTLSSQKAAEPNYLGESSQTKDLRRELKSMRRQMQQQQQRSPQPAPQQMQTNVELENELLKEKLRNAELKNQLLQKTWMQPKAEKIEKYSTSRMHHFFNGRKQRDELARKVMDEEQNLKMMITNLKEMDSKPKQHHVTPRAKPQAQLQADVFLQVADEPANYKAADGEIATPMYQMHKEQADDDIRKIRALAQSNKN